jgi:hypothetical protein
MRWSTYLYATRKGALLDCRPIQVGADHGH